MPDDRLPRPDPDRPPGPRRYVPVPGVVDLDALDEDPPPATAPPLAAPPVAPDDAGPDATEPDAAEPGAAEPGTPEPGDVPTHEAEPVAATPTRQPDEALAGDVGADGGAEGDGFSGATDARDAPPAEAGGPPPAPGTGRSLVPAPVVESAREAARGRGRELVQLVLRYGRRHVPVSERPPPAPDAGPPRMVGRVGQLIPYLRVIPWLLAAVFAFSFVWDFEGRTVELFGQTLALDGMLKLLSVSGLIGFGTNWLAITMLFQPREKRAVIPQGLIPAQRERVIYRLSEAISRELINADIIKQKIQESGVIGRYRDLAVGVIRGVVEDPGFRTELKDLAAGYAQEVLGSEAVRREVAQLAVQKVEQQAGQGLGGVALRLYRTFAEDDFQRRVDRALDELPSAVVPLLDRIDTALDAVPAKVEARADEIEEVATRAVLSFVESFDIRAMIQEKARGFDEAQLENLLKSTSNEQLNYIKYLGAVLGVFGGFVIWQPVGALALFVSVGLALWAVDEALVRARRARA